MLPETYDLVTILFTEIAHFESVCTSWSPLQIIEFLGSMYHSLDGLLDRHDVHKIESIKDLYLVRTSIVHDLELV